MSILKPQSVGEYAKSASGVLGLVALIWTGIVYAVEYEQSLVKHTDMQQAVNELKRDSLGDKIFELRTLGKDRTDVQDAMLDRYEQKLKRIEAQDAKNK